MFRRPFYRSDLIWLGLIAAAVAAPWLMPEFRAEIPTDSFRTGPRGKKAFYLIADELEYAVARSFQPLTTFVRRQQGFEYDTVLLMLGTARTPTPAEWEALASFVSAGGAIVFAAPLDEPEFDAGPFDVSSRELEAPLNGTGEPPPIRVDLGELTGTFSWLSRGELIAPDATPVVVADESVQAVVQPYGAGVAVFVASDRPFDNRMLTWPDNGVLAFRLLEATGYRSAAVFDESLNVSGTPKVVALLFDRPLRPFTFHLLAVLIAYGWWRSRRFGPFSPPSVQTRSDIVAHADAVGILHYKTRDGRAALRGYLRQLTHDLKLKRLSGVREERILDPIARRLDRPVDDVKNAFRQAAAALKRDSLDRSLAAKHIRRLARVRRASRRQS